MRLAEQSKSVKPDLLLLRQKKMTNENKDLGPARPSIIEELELMKARFSQQVVAASDQLVRFQAFKAERDALQAELAALREQKPIGEFKESEYDGDPAFYWVDRIPPIGTKLYAAPLVSDKAGAVDERAAFNIEHKKRWPLSDDAGIVGITHHAMNEAIRWEGWQLRAALDPLADDVAQGGEINLALALEVERLRDQLSEVRELHAKQCCVFCNDSGSMRANLATQTARADAAERALTLFRPYVESAALRSYDGTNGHAMREEARRRLVEVDTACPAQPVAADVVQVPRDLLVQTVAEWEHDNDRYLIAKALRALLATSQGEA